MAGSSFGLLPVRLEDQMNHVRHEGPQNGSHDVVTLQDDEFPSKLHIKPRPRSSQGIRSVLSPSPNLIENRRGSKDDSDVLPTPSTPKRYSSLSHGLSLQMPPRDLSSTSTANLSKRVPISPRPDCTAAYPSPTSVLPRRSRGLDFARAATNLHHSVLAESSPESSPTVSGRRGLNLPGRRSVFATADVRNDPDNMRNGSSSHWATLTNGSGGGVLSSSVGSSAIMDNDSSSTSSDEMMDVGDDDEDTIHMTPHNGPHLLNPFAPIASSPGGDGMGAMTPAAAKLMSYQRNRLQSRRNRTRGSSSSTSGQSNMQSPVPPSPPLLRSIESNLSMNSGYFLDDSTRKELDSRRESLSLGTNEMQISDAEQSADETHTPIGPQEDFPIPTPVTPSMEERRQVIRKAVTRRGNLLPKSKGFARIKAALLEEGAPIDTELRREAEVVRQVRDGDGDGDLSLQPSQPTTSASSPSLGPINTAPTETADGNAGDLSTSSEDSMRRRSSTAFVSQAARNSGGTTFWNKFDERMRTPPPPLLQRANSSGMSGDEMNMDVSQSSTATLTPQASGLVKSNSNDSSATNASNMTTTTFEVPRKGTKRMRDDDFDPNYFKRRAVSPGLSVQNSPVLPQSPGWWGTPKREERVSSNGSAGSGAGTGKRVGMQGMNDTNDGLMNMSIE